MSQPVLIVMRKPGRYRVGRIERSDDSGITLVTAAGGSAGSPELVKLGTVFIPWKKVKAVIREENR